MIYIDLNQGGDTMGSTITLIVRHGRYFIGFRDVVGEVRLLPTTPRKFRWFRSWTPENCPLIGELDYDVALRVNLDSGKVFSHHDSTVAEWFSKTHSSVREYLLRVNRGEKIMLPVCKDFSVHARTIHTLPL
jgi:hypothetical protein